MRSNLKNFFIYDTKFFTNLTRPWLLKWRMLPAEVFIRYGLVCNDVMINCDNSSSTKFTVADALWLLQPLLGIDTMIILF